MKVLAIGDVIGRPGRAALRGLLRELRRELGVDAVIANGENAAGGVGLTAQTADDMLAAGVDVITLGNHTWKHERDIVPYLEREPRIVRPLNYPRGTPGRGFTVIELAEGRKLAVLNLIGRVFMEPVENPFAAAEVALEELARTAPGVPIIVDMHAEASSEKRAMGHHLDGRVAAMFGTHTHVPTADEEVLPGGTGYLSDVGMTGPYDSVIGMEKSKLVTKFMTNRPMPYVVANSRIQLRGVVFDIDEQSGCCRAVERVRRDYDEQASPAPALPVVKEER